MALGQGTNIQDWETEPFTGKAGTFPETGAGYDAPAPDDTAWQGITRPDLFDENGGFVPDGVVLDKTPVGSPAARI